MPLDNVFLRPQTWSRLTPLLLKHYYRRQGICLSEYRVDSERVEKFRSGKTDLVRFQWGVGEGLLKDKFLFFEASKFPYLRGEICLQNALFLYAKRVLFETPLTLDRVSFFHS